MSKKPLVVIMTDTLRRPWRSDARPASYPYAQTKRVKPGDPGFTPQPLNYSTGMPAINQAVDPATNLPLEE